MPLLSISSDFGNQDIYTPIVLTKAIGILPEFSLISITHDLTNSIAQTVYIIKSTILLCNGANIHIILRKNIGDYIAFFYLEHLIVCPNDGFITLFHDREDFTAFKLETSNTRNIIEKSELIFKFIKKYFNQPLLIDSFLPKTNDIKVLNSKRLAKTFNIKNFDVDVLHIDNNGNVVFNITKENFNDMVQNNFFQIEIETSTKINTIYDDYYQGPEDKIFFWFNPVGFLELVLKCGNAANIFNFAIPSSTFSVQISSLSSQIFKKLQIKIRILPPENQKLDLVLSVLNKIN